MHFPDEQMRLRSEAKRLRSQSYLFIHSTYIEHVYVLPSHWGGSPRHRPAIGETDRAITVQPDGGDNGAISRGRCGSTRGACDLACGDREVLQEEVSDDFKRILQGREQGTCTPGREKNVQSY